MFLKSKIYRVALACCLILTMFVLTFADTIRLKDGGIIKGKITSFGDGKFTIIVGEGSRQRTMNFFADEVESIEFDSMPIPTSSNTKTTLPTYTDTTTKKDPNTTVITVGKPDPTPTPTPSKSVIITDTTSTIIQPSPTPTPTNPNTTTESKPVTLNVKVLADDTANGWTNSGWVVRKGQKIRILGKGQINLGSGRYASAAGIGSLPDKDKLMATEATGGLIAVIGDDNNEFIFVGASREFVAPRDGALFLGINEGNLKDNSGSFEVSIEIMPN